LQEQNVNQ